MHRVLPWQNSLVSGKRKLADWNERTWLPIFSILFLKWYFKQSCGLHRWPVRSLISRLQTKKRHDISPVYQWRDSPVWAHIPCHVICLDDRELAWKAIPCKTNFPWARLPIFHLFRWWEDQAGYWANWQSISSPKVVVKTLHSSLLWLTLQ